MEGRTRDFEVRVERETDDDRSFNGKIKQTAPPLPFVIFIIPLLLQGDYPSFLLCVSTITFKKLWIEIK